MIGHIKDESQFRRHQNKKLLTHIEEMINTIRKRRINLWSS